MKRKKEKKQKQKNKKKETLVSEACASKRKKKKKARRLKSFRGLKFRHSYNQGTYSQSISFTKTVRKPVSVNCDVARIIIGGRSMTNSTYELNAF